MENQRTKMRQFRWIIIVLAAVMVLRLCSNLSVHAMYENTYCNTGNQIEDLIHVAETQLGYTPDGEAKYNQWNGKVADSYHYAWCHTFVSWCAEQAGIGVDIIPKTESVPTGKGFFTQKKRWMDSSEYVPRRGDIVYFSQTGDASFLTHVGIVTGTEDGTLYTIEGNVSNQVLERSYALSSEKIIGYGCPLYEGVPNLIVPSAVEINTQDGFSSSAMFISWSQSVNAADYCVKIWRADTQEEVFSKETTEGTIGIYIQLEAGTYEIQVGAINGDNVTYSKKESFSIYDEPEPTVMQVEVGDSETPTRFTWSPAAHAEGYILSLYYYNGTDASSKLWDFDGVDPFEIQLAPGMYIATMCSYSHDFYSDPDKVRFTIVSEDAILGDLSQDQIITTSDVYLLQQYLLHNTSIDDTTIDFSYLTKEQARLADLNEDGIVNGMDLALLRQKLLT